ncbi:RNA polymerase sigma factor [Gorillibacterium sp. CAU 1737]|uniref:RNA polymerase sigma factor n=1 Tax=Gorillibacterium sp. CAU 1737 TaxID=3140362 RepID=UPI003260BABF
MNRTSEEEELRHFVNGSRTAFEALVLRYRQPAVGFARHYVHDYHMAEDLVQDAFAYLYVYPEKYDFRSSFKTYLFTLIRHKCIDYLRKRERRKEDGTSSGDRNPREAEPEESILCDPKPGPEEHLLLQESWLGWERRLGELKGEYRSALYLVDVEGMHPREAAAVLGKTSAGFRVTLHRARKKLRESVEKEEDHERVYEQRA